MPNKVKGDPTKGKRCPECRYYYIHGYGCSFTTREAWLKAGLVKPKTVGEQLMSLQDLRKVYPAQVIEKLTEVRLSDELLKKPKEWVNVAFLRRLLHEPLVWIWGGGGIFALAFLLGLLPA